MLTNEIILLKLIEVNGSLLLLRKQGLTHSQIAELIERERSVGNLIITENGIELTEKGRSLLSENMSRLQIKEKKGWIIRQAHHYREPLSQKAIILPKKI